MKGKFSKIIAGTVILLVGFAVGLLVRPVLIKQPESRFMESMGLRIPMPSSDEEAWEMMSTGEKIAFAFACRAFIKTDWKVDTGHDLGSATFPLFMSEYSVNRKIKMYPNIAVHQLAGMSGWAYFDDDFLSELNKRLAK